MVVQALHAMSGTASYRPTRPAAESTTADRWDQFVEATPGGDLVQTTAWAQTKRALGFEACELVSHRGDEIVAGGQIVIKRFGPLGGIGYIARGPLVSDGEPGQIARILDEIERSARAKRVRCLIVQPPAGGGAIAAALAARGYGENAPAVAPTATIRIDLSQSLDQILARMATRRRREVRRVERLAVDVKLGGRDDIDSFHAMHELTAQRHGFAALSRTYLCQQWESLHPRGWLQLFLAYHEGRPLAGIWNTAFGDTVTYRVPGWSGEERNLRLNVACHWRAIQWAKQNGYRYYDFGGIDRGYAERTLAGEPVPEEFLQSPGGFKVLFGGELVLLPTAHQFIFNPVARLIGGLMLSQLPRRKSLRRLADRVRNG